MGTIGGMGDADHHRWGRRRMKEGETQRAEEGLGEWVPMVGCHHEESMAANCLLQIERLGCLREW